MDQPKVIVLILSYNGKALLDDALTSYLDNDYGNFEVVVIDNGSSDGTESYVNHKWPEVTVYRTPENLGYSGGFNFGLDYAFNQKKADYVLISNNDVKVDTAAVRELVNAAEQNHKIGFVTGKVYFFDRPEIFQSTGFQFRDEDYWLFRHRGDREPDQGQYDQPGELEFSDDIYMLVSRAVYEKTKGYDLDFFIQSEQFDWQIRAKKQGFIIYYTPYAKLWHKESMTIGKTSAFKTYYNVRNNFVVRLKHREKAYLQKYFQWYLVNVVTIPLLKHTLKLKLKYTVNILSGFFSALRWGFSNGKINLKGFK